MTGPVKALVTGGAKGIGWAIVRQLSAQGVEVTVLDFAPLPEPACARLVHVDLLNLEETSRILAELCEETTFSYLVNNVGMVCDASLEKTTIEDFRAVQDLNQGCALLCAQAVVPNMKTAGFGRIVNISSRAALGKERRTSYAASKAGLIGFTRTWALELGRTGITVNAVAPGPIATELFDEANRPDDPRTRAIIDTIPVGRVGNPQDVANAVNFFLTEDSSFITGQVLYVCGGMTVGHIFT